jgi:hypothetical protein
VRRVDETGRKEVEGGRKMCARRTDEPYIKLAAKRADLRDPRGHGAHVTPADADGRACGEMWSLTAASWPFTSSSSSFAPPSPMREEPWAGRGARSVERKAQSAESRDAAARSPAHLLARSALSPPNNPHGRDSVQVAGRYIRRRTAHNYQAPVY